MDNLIESKDLYYVPAKKIFGNESFQGIPCPTQKAYEILGDRGIKIIQNKFKEMLLNTATRFGESSIKKYAFHPIQKFVDLRTNTVFRVGGTINGRLTTQKNRQAYNMPISKIPEFVIENRFKTNQYELLQETNHYIIEVSQILSKNIDPKVFYNK